MTCPNCGAEMEDIEILDKEQEIIKFDNCDHCGSFWLNDTKIDRLNKYIAEDIDVEEVIHEKPVHATIDCPFCHVPLQDYKHPQNEEVKLLRCRECQGILLRRGQLRHLFGFVPKPAKQSADPTGTFSKRDRILTGFISLTMFLFTLGLAYSRYTGCGSFSADSLVASSPEGKIIVFGIIGLSLLIFVIGLILAASNYHKTIRLLGWASIIVSIIFLFFMTQ